MTSTQENNLLLQYGNLQLPSSQVVLIYTEWNQTIIESLKQGALSILYEFPQVSIDQIQVPGALEIPYAIAQYHQNKPADAYITLGCVIKGETPHFNYVCQSVVEGITHLNLQLSSPVIFGVLTVNNEDEAWDRLGGKHGHKGKEAAIAALKMIAFKHSLKNE